MKLLKDIQIAGKDSQDIPEEFPMSGYFKGVELSELLWERYDELIPSEVYWTDLIYVSVEDTEAKRIKALLREMRVRMLKPIGSVKRLKRILFSHISLLFGMCSSQSSLILNAFYGNSLSRIPTV